MRKGHARRAALFTTEEQEMQHTDDLERCVLRCYAGSMLYAHAHNLQPS